jgi:hypothetical protein
MIGMDWAFLRSVEERVDCRVCERVISVEYIH